MGSQRTSGGPTTRQYSPAEKEQAVRMVRQLRAELGTTHGTIQRVASQIGCGVESLRTWVRQAEIDSGDQPGVTTAEAARIKVLEQENRELRRANPPQAGIGFLRGGARPPTEVMNAFIDERRGEHGVEPICRVLQVAPSTYYSAKSRPASARAVRDVVLMAVIVTLWQANYRVYGVRKMWKALGRAGQTVGRDQVARLLAGEPLENQVSEALARRAAELRRRAGRGSAVDALVVALAEPGGTVLTGDTDDLEALAAHAHGVDVERV